MKKIYEQMLANFKKSNKEGKLRLAKQFNFKSSEEFLEFLNGKLGVSIKGKSKVGDTKGRKKPAPVAINASPSTVIHNVHILDASSSMFGEKFNNALAGINKEIEELKKDKTVNYTQTTVIFSYYNQIKTVSLLKPISEVHTIEGIASGNTALYDAVGSTLQTLQANIRKGDKVIVKIFTDGEENDSHRFSAYSVGEMIKNLELEGFTITFVGTKRDVNTAISKLKIDPTNTLVHDNTAKGVTDSFQTSTVATMSYARDVKAGKKVTKGFYTKRTGTLQNNQ
jgi:uncharacterized protein YegL